MEPAQIDALRNLVLEHRVLSLAVVVDGEPVIGLLPFAVTADWRALVVHASRLARHTRGLVEGAAFDALVHDHDTADVDALQVPRVTLRGTVHPLPAETEGHAEARDAYLSRFPHAEPIAALGDFTFFRLDIAAGRLVTGFAAAVNVTVEALQALAGGGRG